MYKKLKFFKMFLGTILMTLTLISVLKSCSYAYTIDDFILFATQIPDTASTNVKIAKNTILNRQTQIKTLINNNNLQFKSIFAVTTFWSNSDYRVDIYFSNLDDCPFTSSSTTLQFQKSNLLSKSIQQRYWNSWSQSVDNVSSAPSVTTSNSFGLIQSSSTIPNNNFYYQNKYVPPYNGPVFTPVDNGMINVTNSLGTTIQMNRLPFSRSLTSWKIGNITDIDDSILTIKGHFGPLISSDNDGDITNTKYQFIWRKGDNVTSNGFTIASDGNVYINTQYLIPNQSYNAWFWYSTDNVNTTDFGDTWFYAYYNTSNPTSGDAISSNLNDDTDIGFINAFGDLVSPQPEDIESTANSIFQNPYGSGEFFGITYDEDFDDWGFGTFIYNLIQGIITTFTSFNNVTMDFGVLGAINSSAFSIGNSYVGAFLSFFCNAILVITLIFWYYRLVKSFATLDLTTISKYDFDKMFNIF